MSCPNVAKFVITKGVDNTFIFTIKADGSTLPMAIRPSDTFMARLARLDNDTVVLTKNLTILDALSGRVQYLITTTEASSLIVEKGPKVDRYYTRPTYKLIIDCRTINNGNFIAKVGEVYVD